MNNNLRGIVIDAGHGGSDPGAVSGNNYEKEFNRNGIYFGQKWFNAEFDR